MELNQEHIVIAAAIVATLLICFAVDRFLTRHPKLKSTLCWIMGIIGCLGLLAIPGIGIVLGLILGLVIGIRHIWKNRDRDRQRMEEITARHREELAEDWARWERKKALSQLERGSRRAQADELEKKARHWEYLAKKTRAPRDIKQAEYYRDLANAARRKVY